ncbi:MAG TPA: BtpA family membrane complex biogenesis protein, partial [Thermoplasmatales archaeon]|nr:BtpA family membrane complex biogenesis protein [Thermoplasmatales archaeon]
TMSSIERIQKTVSVPVLIGSGLSLENAGELFPLSDGAIVGSSFKKGGDWRNRVDFKQASNFMEKIKSIRGNG